MNIIFRNVDRANLNELRQIAEIDVTIPQLFDPNFQGDEKAVLESLSRLQNKIKEEDFFEVATSDEEIVGYHVVRKSVYAGHIQAGYVETLWVAEKFRRKGIGSQLKRHAEEWGRKINFIILPLMCIKRTQKCWP